MNNGRLDRALLLAILAALGGLIWQVFSMNARLARVETHLQYVVVPQLAEPSPDTSPNG